MPEVARLLETQGFALLLKIAAPDDISALNAVFERTDLARAERDGKTYGARNLLGLAEVQQFAKSVRLAEHLLPLMGRGFHPVRGIFFDKTEGANWPVLWHQDLSLAVESRQDLPGWTGWSVKRGVQHAQAPAEVLAQMVTVRLHLDDCPADNGPLRVIPASHRQKLTREAIRTMAEGGGHIVTARTGDALLMRPLLLHASSPAKMPSHRRVLHLEFAPAGLLPPGLNWAKAN